MKKIMMICLLSLSMWGLQAQNFTEDLTKMQEAYENIQQLHLEMSVKVYDIAQSREKIHEQSLEYYQDANQYYCAYDRGETTIRTPDVLFMSNKEQERIWYQENPPVIDDPSQHLLLSQMPLDELESNYETIEYKGTEGNNKCYRLIPKEGQTKEIFLWINATTYMMHKMQYDYHVPQWEQHHEIILSCDKINLNPTIPEDVFSINKFIHREGDEYKGQGVYKDYQVIIIE